MKPVVRWTVAAVGAAAVVVLFLVVRPGGEGDPPVAAAASSRSPTAESSTPPSASSSPTEPVPAVERIEVRVQDGNVRAPSDTEVSQGSKVRIVVRSDVADEVHVHGYDLMTDVEAGGTATVDFVADAPGVFEVELENAGTLLFELTVSP
jgi:hypothetical protein